MTLRRLKEHAENQVREEWSFITEYGRHSLGASDPKITIDVVTQMNGPTTILTFTFYLDGELFDCVCKSSAIDGVVFSEGWTLKTDDPIVLDVAEFVWNTRIKEPS